MTANIPHQEIEKFRALLFWIERKNIKKWNRVSEYFGDNSGGSKKINESYCSIRLLEVNMKIMRN